MSNARKSLICFIGLSVLTLPALAKEPKQVPVNPPVCSFHIVQNVHKGEQEWNPGLMTHAAPVRADWNSKTGQGHRRHTRSMTS